MGCNQEVDNMCDQDELPSRTVTLSAYQIDKYEVTQDAYAACVDAGSCPPPQCSWDCSRLRLPATCVTWDAANAFCAWAGKRLPTEAEWEKAARGTDARVFPWGNQQPSCDLANMAGCSGAATPVGSFAAGKSPYGAFDMAGNMVEMVADWYDPSYYSTAPAADPAGPTGGNQYVGRGGGFKSTARWHRTSDRDKYDLEDQGASLGFRCAK